MGSFGDFVAGDSGVAGKGGLRTPSKRVSSAPVERAVEREAYEYDDAEDALRVGRPTDEEAGEPMEGNCTLLDRDLGDFSDSVVGGDLGETTDSVSWSYASPLPL